MQPPEPRPFELAPPPPARPVEWRRSLRLLRALVRDPGATEQVFELFDATGGSGDERAVQRCAEHPAGRRLFAERPSLLAELADFRALAALPALSFGRAYLAFAEENGFSVDGLLRANERGLGPLNRGLDPERRWFFVRVNLMHDLWHVLTGYGTDAAGETALLAFSAAQGLSSRTVWLLLASALALAPKRDGLAFQRFVVEAHRRGRRAQPLLVQPYEGLLPRPLADVRRELGIQRVRDAHPRGVFRAAADNRGVVRVAA